MLETVEIDKPKPTPKLTNHDILLGKPLSPLQRLATFSDDDFEEIVQIWAYEYLGSRYSKVRRCGGAGDKGRDIIAWKNGKDWDNYQCKFYEKKLTPTNFYVELSKLCYYTKNGDYPIPQKYFLVSREGIGPKLGDLISKPDDLKKLLIKNWKDYVEKNITKSQHVRLEGDMKRYVEDFDFGIIETIEPHEMLQQFKNTSYYLYFFGGQIQKNRIQTVVPEFIENEKQMRYVEQLLIAYSEELSDEINRIEDLEKYGNFKIHFELQRQNFYSIETLKQFERDNLPPDSTAFEDFKTEVLTAVYSKVLNVYENSFKRLQSILDHSGLLNITSNPLSVTLSVMDKNGICHHLVNENKLSWKI